MSHSTEPVIEPVTEPVTAPGQEQIWFFDRMTPGAVFHTVALRARVDGPVDVAALRGALDLLVARHPSLRTVFAGDDGQLTPVPMVDPAAPLTERDVTSSPPAERVAEADRLLAAELARPFDLANGQLLRVLLVHLGTDEHALLLTAHHIAVDGQSLLVLRHELVRHYADLAAGRTPQPPPVRLTYTDVARRQHELVRSGEAEAHREFWSHTLAALPAPLDLGSATDADGYAGDRVPLVLPAGLAAAVDRLAAQERSSSFMVLLSAFAVLLHRAGRADDLVIGTPTAGRLRPGAEELVGHLVNMLPLRLRVDPDPTLRQVLAGVRSAAMAAYAHQELPFQEVVRVVQPERRPGVHPIFQVVFAVPPELDSVDIAGATTFSFQLDTSPHALYDLEAQLPASPGERRGYLKYRTARFSRPAAESLADQYVRLLDTMVADPDRHLSNVRWLSGTERDLVVSRWNDTATGYPRERSLGSLFEEWADRSPQTLALDFDDGRYTYRELDERANRLARYLRGQGVGADGRVGLCLGRGSAWVVGALAAVKAGAGYVPLDPDYPTDRLAYMVEDARTDLVLVDAATRDRFAADISVVDLDRAAEAVAAGSADRLGDLAVPDSLAYIMYTSGSTGRPKGVAVTHRNVVRLVRDTDYVEFRPDDAVAQTSNISFDAATFEVWGALLSGARLVGMFKEDILDPRRLAARIRERRIDTLFLTTSLAMQVARDHPEAVRPLRYFVFGGEQPNLHAVRTSLAHGAPTHLVNGYGPTETTTFAATYRCNELAADETLVPLGRPIANTRLYVLDPYLEPVPPGTVGELYIGGDGVGRGYVNRPDLTADRFVPDHLGGEPGTRLYRTGDLARYRPDGVLEFLGRSDRQVKVRGFRIEPGEIEDALDRSGLVRQATVQAWRDEHEEATLVGYAVPASDENGEEVTEEALRGYLRAHLPEYMVPSVLFLLPSLPLTDNGKLDVRALPDPAERLRGAGAGEVATTPTERLVADIWRAVLGVPDVGRDDDFFGLGGHSLKATQVISRTAEATGCEVPIGLIFEHQTLAGFAAAVDHRLATAGTVTGGSGGTGGPGGPLARAAAPAAGDVGDLLDELDRLSDAEVARVADGDR